MSRYIDSDALLEEFKTLEQLARKRVCDTPTNSPAYERYRTQYSESIIKAQATADVVEVVRCENCRFSFYINSQDELECRKHNGCLKFPRDFCSYGERRIEG